MPPKLPRPCWTASGNDATPHKQEQEQAPVPSVVPLPLATDAAGGGAAAVVAAGGAGGAAEAGGGVPLDVPFCWMAIAWNMSWVLSAVGLMLKVIPLPQ